MATVAFLGLGNMGRGMAARLLDAGHTVRVWNRSPERAAALVARGAIACTKPRLAAEGASAVFAMVADDDASRSAWLGPDGAMAATPSGDALAIECSTLSHDWVLELGHRCGERGLRYVDCPVTGLPAAAAGGALTLLVGAAEADLDRARPLLGAISTEIIRFGPVGAGTVYKLLINLMGAAQIAAAAEGFALAEKAGLDLATVAAAVARGQAASPQVVRNTGRFLANDHAQNVLFTGRLRLKDAEYAVRLAEKLGLAATVGGAARDVYRRLIEQGLGDVNESMIVDVVRASGRRP